MKSGFIAIVGKPNAGKSTLTNALLKTKVSITSSKAQTTRNAIIGVLNNQDYQIVLCDTPGIHKASSTLGNYMNKEALNQVEGVDIIYYIIDAKKGLDETDDEILKGLFVYEIPIFLLINKIDSISKEALLKRVVYASSHYDFKEIIPISALQKDNLNELINTSLTYFNDSIAFYPEDYITNVTSEFRTSEAIREKILERIDEEIPHMVACKVDAIKESEKRVKIEASIIVNKESHKGIIIGHNGKMLNRINMAATKDIEAIYHKKVILSLFVKVEEDWMNKNSKLMDLGFLIGNKYDH